MKHYRIYQVDSFTKKRFEGNPAGVVTVMVEAQNGKPVKVQVGGEATIAFKTEMEI